MAARVVSAYHRVIDLGGGNGEGKARPSDEGLWPLGWKAGSTLEGKSQEAWGHGLRHC